MAFAHDIEVLAESEMPSAIVQGCVLLIKKVLAHQDTGHAVIAVAQIKAELDAFIASGGETSAR